MSAREVLESPYEQGVDEAKAYVFTAPTSWGTAPFTNHSGALYSWNPSTKTYTDVTSSLMSGSQTSSGQVITTPRISGLTEGVAYRYEGKFDNSEGDTMEFYSWINAKR